MKPILYCLVPVLILAGCAKKEEPKPETQKKEEPSLVKTAIEGATGRTAVNALHKAKKDIKKAEETRNQNLDAVLEEK